MPLNASSDMPLFSVWYCGICWYLWNASSQALSPSGGSAPMIGCHSVIDSPDPVSRVAPPTTTIASTNPAIANSHSRNAASDLSVAPRPAGRTPAMLPIVAIRLNPLHRSRRLDRQGRCMSR